MYMVNELALKVQSFAKCYQEATKIWRRELGIPDDLDEIKNDAYLAIIFLTDTLHARSGANPNFPRYHRLAIKEALQGRRFSDAIIRDEKYPERVWEKFVSLTGGKPNKGITEGVVKDLLEKIRSWAVDSGKERRPKQPNIIKLLGSNPLPEANKFLVDINGIGPKISALILRDLEYFFGFWTDELRSKPQNYYLLQPVDRWVRRISKLCWPDLNLPNNHDSAAKLIVKKCSNSELDPIEFNQGAWFIGSYFNRLLFFHRLPEKVLDRDSIKRFDADKVMEGITNFMRYKFDRTIFVI